MLLYYALGEKGLAGEEWKLAIAYGLPIGALFFVTFVYNLLAIPVRREHILHAKIKCLEPDLPILTAIQEAILRRCKVSSPSDEHWLKNNQASPTVDRTNFQPARYTYTMLKAAIENLEKNGWAEKMTDFGNQFEMSFTLKPMLINAMKARGMIGDTTAPPPYI